MEFAGNAIYYVLNPLKDFITRSAYFVTKTNTPPLQQPMLAFIIFIFIFGTSSIYLSSMFLTSILTVLIAGDLSIFLEKFEYKDMGISHLQRILQLILDNGINFSLIFCFLTAISAPYVSGIPLPIKLYLFCVYYMKTIYPLASITDFFLESLICTSIFMLVAYVVYDQQLLGEIISSFFFSLYGSTLSIAIANRMSPLEVDIFISRLFSANGIGHDKLCNSVFLAVMVSAILQQIIRIVLPRLKKMVQKAR